MSHIFVAVRVPDAIGNVLNEWTNFYKEKVPLKIWTYKEDLHITLEFLGDVAGGDLQQLKSNLTNVAGSLQGFELQITDTGTFGSPKTPRVLWAGVNKEEGLFKLQEKVHASCADAGYRVDSRPYRPHITLGKKWNGMEALDFDLSSHKEDKELRWAVNDFVIFEIFPKNTPKYKVMETYKLK